MNIKVVKTGSIIEPVKARIQGAIEVQLWYNEIILNRSTNNLSYEISTNNLSYERKETDYKWIKPHNLLRVK